jgi:hypothetical protein
MVPTISDAHFASAATFSRERPAAAAAPATLWTRTVPANPLRPAMPRGGGKAQSSPTITVYKGDSIILLAKKSQL